MRLKLTRKDLELLDKETVGQGGMQWLLRSLKSSRIGNYQHLTSEQVERIFRYAFSYGSGNFQDQFALLAMKILRSQDLGRSIRSRLSLGLATHLQAGDAS